MANSLGYLHKLYAVQRIRSKKGDDETNCLNHFIMNLKQQDIQHLFYKAVSNLVRRELILFFCLTSNWYGLNCYKLEVPNLVMTCSQKKKLDILLFKKTDEKIYTDCLFHRRKVLHGK